MQDFKELRVGKKAHALSLAIHRAGRRMRASEYSSLRSQMFRAAMSIPTNIAEGRRQKTDKNFARFLGYALNSASELEYHLLVALDTGAIQRTEFASLTATTVSVRKMLYRFVELLESANTSQKNRNPREIPARSPKPAKPKAAGR